ncbi:MAG: glycosyltransferase family 39 protein [Proteobacteria bacterium]|nr:glycosyltransferase family 39 protein [Pseudomonadota bacterium]
MAVTAVFLLLKLAISPFVGLGANEAYAVAGGRLFSLSYFDHPPLHFWLAQSGAMAFGDTGWARLPFIALGAGSSWLMFALTRSLFGERAGVWATLIFNLSIFFCLVAGNWMLPDGPLNFFLLAAALTLSPLAKGEKLSMMRWAAAGLLAGLAALSKYHGLVFVAGVFAFLVSSVWGRRVLRTGAPWLAVLVAAAVFSPVLIWNAQHGWISFGFQGARAATGRHFGGGLFLSLIVAQIALISPWVAWPLARGVIRAAPSSNEAERFLLWLGLPIAILFTFTPLWSDGGMVQWAMPGWLLLLPLAGKYLADEASGRSWPRIWLAVSAALFLLFVLGFVMETRSGWLGSAFPHIFRRGDPTADNVEWTPLGAIVNREALSDDDRLFVLTSGWRDAAKIDQGLAGNYRVAAVSNDPRNFAIGIDPKAWAGRNGWIVLEGVDALAQVAALKSCFGSLEKPSNLTIQRGIRPDATLTIWRGDGFTPKGCMLLSIRNMR